MQLVPRSGEEAVRPGILDPSLRSHVPKGTDPTGNRQGHLSRLENSAEGHTRYGPPGERA